MTVKEKISRMSKRLVSIIGKRIKSRYYGKLFRKYQEFTMIPESDFKANLDVINAHSYNFKNGAIVECGVWKGGMIAAMSEILGASREYFLCDSFEGLPDAKEIDGQKAKDWQADTSSPFYFDNCSAEISFCKKALRIAGVNNYKIIEGWFDETLPTLEFKNGIDVLRLDADWYESTMSCLVNLYPLVNSNGIVVLDDYYTWEGCAKALHDYLSSNKLEVRIRQWSNNACYIVKS